MTGFPTRLLWIATCIFTILPRIQFLPSSFHDRVLYDQICWNCETAPHTLIEIIRLVLCTGQSVVWNTFSFTHLCSKSADWLLPEFFVICWRSFLHTRCRRKRLPQHEITNYSSTMAESTTLASFSINVQLYLQNHKIKDISGNISALSKSVNARNFVAKFYRQKVGFIRKTTRWSFWATLWGT